ncbi:UNVERIFIED_CONTAM: hypothetical protein Slati_4078100 [Sesamum latifolium]|uniref:Uncharacterized protein n=1 Tax=Sesamum latifolium TaxID=2727402 RepID=A0AAW2T7G4_9LAMI
MERKVVIVCCVVAFLGLLSAVSGFAAEAKRIKGDQVQFPSPTECIYPRSPALGLGLTAAVALMIAQIIINVATGCVCCRKGPHQSNSNWTLALVCFIVSWTNVSYLCSLCTVKQSTVRFSIKVMLYMVTVNMLGGSFVIAFLLLLTGAALNDQHGEENLYFGNYYCYVVKPGVFAGAAVLSLASVILGIIYYVTLTQEKNRNNPWAASVPQSGIAMGQPQFPPQNVQSQPQFPPPQNAQAQPQFPPPQNAQGPVFVHEDTYMRRQFT